MSPLTNMTVQNLLVPDDLAVLQRDEYEEGEEQEQTGN
jgi:hypothetical protein